MQTLRDRLVAAAPQLSTERMNAMDDIPFSPPDIRQEDIDAAIRNGLGHPMGPFELMDMVGLDVIDFIAQATYEETGAEEDKPNESISKLVAEGKFGRKSGEGFYEYKK